MNLIRAKSLLLFICLALVGACAITAAAQSGRRQPKPAPAAPVPTPTPEPTPEPKKEDNKSTLTFIIASERNSGFENYPFSYYDAVMAGCAGRLNGSFCPKWSTFSRGQWLGAPARYV